MSKESQGAQGGKSSSSSDTWQGVGGKPTSGSDERLQRRIQEEQRAKVVKPIKQYEMDVESMFEELHISKTAATMQGKMQHGIARHGESEISLVTNVFGMMLTQHCVWRYEVIINGQYKSGIRSVVLNSRPRDDAPKVFYRDDCRDIFLNVVKDPANKEFFQIPEGTSPLQWVAYDCAAYLYSVNKLDFSKARKSEHDEAVLVFDEKSGNFDRFKTRYSRVRFIVRNNNAMPLGTMDYDVKSMDVDEATGFTNRSLLEVTTCQAAFLDPESHVMFDSNTSYLLKPQDFGYKLEDAVDISKDKYLGIGTQKVFRMIEGPKQKPGGAMGLTISAKKTPFYGGVELLTFVTEALAIPASELKIMATGQLDDVSVAILDKYLTGLYVYSNYEQKLENFHKILHVKRLLASEVTFTLPDKSITTIDAYYTNRYKHKLIYPYGPMVECESMRGQAPKTTQGSLFFPLEVLRVCDSQRVRQQSPELIQKIIRACAVAPNRNFQHVINSRKAWGFEKSEIGKEASISVTHKPMTLTGRKMLPPMLRYKNENVLADEKCKWKSIRSNYLIPAKINKWGIYHVADRVNHRMADMVRNFEVRFRKQCTDKGMQVAEAVDFGCLEASLEALEVKFKAGQKADCEFMLFIHDNREKVSHAMYKMLERKYDIVTQGIMQRTVSNILDKNQMLTIENVVNKTNVKMGGLNYSLQLNQSSFNNLLSPDFLYIGLAISKPAGGLSTGARGPDVLGYAANINADPFEFIGDFRFVTGGVESGFKLDVFVDVIMDCIKRFRETRGKNPRNVVIYRHGCDDGHFHTALKFEVPYIEKKLSGFAGGADIKWAFIVPGKMHTVRIYKNEVANPDSNTLMNGQKPMDQNILPGIVVDKSLVHPQFAEFYLCSHSALQGTAKVPRYTILYSTTGFSLDDYERITWGLSFGHQIVNLSVSLPAPSYIANRYAERGRMLYNQSGVVASSDEALLQLTGELCHSNTAYLRNWRVNA